MGLQRSNAGVWGMVVGLLAHEAVVGFSFGLQLASLAKRKVARIGDFFWNLG